MPVGRIPADDLIRMTNTNERILWEPSVALGPSLTRIHEFVSYAVDESAPHFIPAREPLQDGVVYTATSGQNFYRPQVHLGQGPENRPELRFLKDVNGKVRLEFMLEEANLLPGAEPFNVRVTTVALRWNGPTGADQFTFPAPTLAPTHNPANAAQPNFQIRVGAEVTAPEVERLNYALSNTTANAVLDIGFTYSYWVDLPGGNQSPPILPPVIDPPWLIPVIIDPLPLNPLIFNPGVFIQPRASAPQHGADPHDADPHGAEPEAAAHAANARDSGLVNLDFGSPMQLKRVVDWDQLVIQPNTLVELIHNQQTQPNFRSANLTRTLAFTFDPNLAQNRAIYSAIRTTTGVSEQWENTPFGYVRRTDIANTIYRLPDEVRLAFSPDLKAPYMVPVLYRDGAGDIKVRVVLRAAPWHDPQQLVALGDFLYNASGGTLAAPHVVTGGYKEATLRLTGAFPEQIQALAGEELPVELEGGFELTLDLTLEFYRFLCDLLVGVGLSGEIVVTLDNPAGAAGGAAPVRRIPMRLSLDDLAVLPIEVKVSATAASPGQVEIINRTGNEVRCQACLPRLLQVDTNSVVPLVVYQAEATTVFPVTLIPDTPFMVDVKPKANLGVDPTQLLWNAVLIELVHMTPVQSTEAILNRVHELAPANTLTWDILVECPPFTQPTLPAAYQGKLFRLVVEIRRPGFAAQEVVLHPGKPSDTIKMQRTLQEIRREDAQSLTTFERRVKNIYYTEEGAWSEWKPATGTSLFIYPNPSEV